MSRGVRVLVEDGRLARRLNNLKGKAHVGRAWNPRQPALRDGIERRPVRVVLPLFGCRLRSCTESSLPSTTPSPAGTPGSAGCGRMFHAAVFTACQIPDRSGLPSAVRGRACPAEGVGASVRMTTTAIAMSRSLIRIGMCPACDGLAYFGAPSAASDAPRKKFRPSANFTLVPLAVVAPLLERYPSMISSLPIGKSV